MGKPESALELASTHRLLSPGHVSRGLVGGVSPKIEALNVIEPQIHLIMATSILRVANAASTAWYRLMK